MAEKSVACHILNLVSPKDIERSNMKRMQSILYFTANEKAFMAYHVDIMDWAKCFLQV